MSFQTCDGEKNLSAPSHKQTRLSLFVTNEFHTYNEIEFNDLIQRFEVFQRFHIEIIELSND